MDGNKNREDHFSDAAMWLIILIAQMSIWSHEEVKINNFPTNLRFETTNYDNHRANLQ